MMGVQPIELPSLNRISHRPTLQIQELVALSYDIHPRLMTSRSRDRDHAWPRQVAMYLTRKLTKRSLPAIGKAFGDRDHTTVIHAIRAVERRMFSDPTVWTQVQALRGVLERGALNRKPVETGGINAL